MAVERNNPLPIGRYWVDVPPDSKDSFRVWLERNRSFVRVLSTEQGETDWYLFETLTPYVQWQGPGLPTIADEGVRAKDDTGTRRTEGEIRDEMLDDIDELGGGLESIGKAVLFTALGYAVYKVFSR